MLKRVGESRHPCQTPAVVQNQSPTLLLKRTALVALLKRFLMTWIKLVLMYFFMVAHKAACKTLSKAFLKSMETANQSSCRIFCITIPNLATEGSAAEEIIHNHMNIHWNSEPFLPH